MGGHVNAKSFRGSSRSELVCHKDLRSYELFLQLLIMYSFDIPGGGGKSDVLILGFVQCHFVMKDLREAMNFSAM